MPVSTPSGYLDFTNATPRATKVIATSNVGIGTSDPIYSLDVMGTANVGALTATSVDIAGGLSLDLPVATIASNLVTYDTTTGELFDSGGLFSNKLSVVSEQPPSALSGASTTVEKHGIYKVTASTGTPQNAFDKATNTSWVGSSSYTGGGGTGVYVGSTNLATGLEQGDWVAVKLPYKATLRHLTLTAGDGLSTSLPEKANLYATNDTVTWTELKNWQAGETTVLVNATEPYKKYAIVTTKTVGNATLQIGQLKLFCESFSVDGGKIEMATSALTGGASVMEQTTAHDRESAVLKKYPEVNFTREKMEYNTASNTFTQSGYTVMSSSNYGRSDVDSYYTAWRSFTGLTNGYGPGWTSIDGVNAAYTSGVANGNESLSGIDATTSTGGVSSRNGAWLKLELPVKIKLYQVYVYDRYDDSGAGGAHERVQEAYVYGSNDNSTWYELGKQSTATNNSAYTDDTPAIITINTSMAYKYFIIQPTTLQKPITYASYGQVMYYGTEETATEGDTSLDTTIVSKYNTPDLTSASLYLDGLKGSTATDYSGRGIAVTENNVTWDSTEKSWTLSGAATSNVVSADLGFEGDQPHSVSAWVKADQLNGRELFHVGTAEGEGDAASRVGFVDDSHISFGGEHHFFSNAEWHNVTYTYNGEGSDKKLYLDGRLVGSAKNEDTFGDYPPFNMSTYSQYGYTVSASSELSNYPVHYAFDGNTTHAFSANSWICAAGKYDSTGGTGLPVSPAETTTVDGVSKEGEWVQMEFPQRMILDSVSLAPQTDTEQYRAPKDAVIAGSNDGTTWETMRTFTGETSWTDDVFNNYIIDTNVGKSYKYVRIIVLRNQGIINSNTQYTAIAEIKFYARRENDLVRFPDPTNVLKYPHIQNTGGGDAIRGYVFSSSGGSASTPGFAFDGSYNAIGGNWLSSSGTFSSGVALSTETFGGSGSTINGPWLKVEMTNKILPTKLNMFVRESTNSNPRQPRSGTIYGSVDDSSWTNIGSFSYTNQTLTGDSTPNEITLTPSPSGTHYKYFLLHVTQMMTAKGASDRVSITGMEIYGTEEDLDVVARIGDGYDGKVRNLRVFSTALSQDRVQEIFDADKDAFGLAKSSVSVYRGHLGIGTTEPKAALTVMDEVGELEEFPPRAMTADETYIEGHGVFRASVSSDDSGHFAFNAFNKKFEWNEGWISASAFTTTTGYADSSSINNVSYFGAPATYISIQMPYKISLQKIKLQPHIGGSGDPRKRPLSAPKDFDIWARSGKGLWQKLVNYTDAVFYQLDGYKEFYEVNSSDFFDEFALVIRRTHSNSSYSWTSGTNTSNLAMVGEWRLFGTREQGASTLHNGELTLTRNLTVPRIGPALDADDTPRRDRLVVEYNTSTNPTENGVVKDTSGRGLDGRMVGVTYDTSDKAFVSTASDGSQWIDTRIHSGGSRLSEGISGSIWVNQKYFDTSTKNSFIWSVGDRSGTGNNREIAVGYNIVGGTLKSFVISFIGGTGNFNLSHTSETPFDVWTHVGMTYDGTTVKLYINGVYSVSTTSTDVNIPNTNCFLRLNGDVVSANSTHQGTPMSLSNFKLYDVALTADEVKRLYEMGRCDEGHHVVNFSKTRVGIGLGDGEAPRGALDVRGSAFASKYFGGLTTFLTGDYTSTAITSFTSVGQTIAMIEYTFDVPQEYHLLGRANLESQVMIKWCGEIEHPWNFMFYIDLYHSGLSTAVKSAVNTDSSSSRSNGAGVPVVNHHADYGSTLESAMIGSRIYIPNCDVSSGSTITVKLVGRRGNYGTSATVYTNRTKNDNDSLDYERGITNFFMALKVV